MITMLDHATEWVMTSVTDANSDLAREYALHMERMEDDGDVDTGTSHVREFERWAEANCRACQQCGYRYAHRIAGAATYVCGACGCAANAA